MHFVSRKEFHRLAAVLLLCGALLLTTGAVNAAGDASVPTPLDVFCVNGSVINHQEQPIGGWTITAVMYDPATGLLDATTAMDVETINVEDSPDGALGSFHFGELGPGRWNIAIGTQAGWSPVTAASQDITLTFGKIDCETIRFKMRQEVTVTVLKIDANHQPLPGYTIHARPGKDNFFASAKQLVTGDDGLAIFTLTPGLWEFEEAAPAGVKTGAVSPSNGKQSLDVTAPGPHSIRFKNRVFDDNLGCIEVIKRDVPPAGSSHDPTGLPGWFISVKRADGSAAGEGTTNATGHIRFEKLPYGPYTVHEQMPATGWEAAAPVHYAVTLDSPDCVTVEFYNQQVEPAYCIVGRKVDAHGKVGLPGWEITAKPTKASNYEPGAVITNGLGNFRIDFPLNDYRVPEAEYEVCETAMDGWLAHTATCQKVRLPKDPGNCVALGFDFENQQVGHSEAESMGGCASTYTVKAGDQLYRIGKSHGKSAKEMRDANPKIKNPNRIYVGQKVCIP